jgi:DNA polymerase III epsilon subunit-like protein
MAADPTMHCVLDIEASGFGRQSYPIEVGWALADGRTGCMLVRPPEHWTHWDESAERVHGITRETLHRHGRPPREVAVRLNQELGDNTVYSDAWGHDYAWLARLFDEAEMPRSFKLEAAASLFGETLLGQLDEVHKAAFTDLAVTRHRASNDARALQRALQALEVRPGRRMR